MPVVSFWLSSFHTTSFSSVWQQPTNHFRLPSLVASIHLKSFPLLCLDFRTSLGAIWVCLYCKYFVHLPSDWQDYKKLSRVLWKWPTGQWQWEPPFVGRAAIMGLHALSHILTLSSDVFSRNWGMVLFAVNAVNGGVRVHDLFVMQTTCSVSQSVSLAQWISIGTWGRLLGKNSLARTRPISRWPLLTILSVVVVRLHPLNHFVILKWFCGIGLRNINWLHTRVE